MEIINQIRNGEYADLNKLIDSLFEKKLNESLRILQATYQQVESLPYSKEKIFVIEVLENLWNLFHGVSLMLNSESQNLAIEELTVAKNGFEQLEFELLTNQTEILNKYCKGILEFQQLHLLSGLNKIKVAKAEFDKSSTFFNCFSDILDAIESDSLFICGTNLILQLDYENGQIAIEKASNLIKSIATKQGQNSSVKFENNSEYNYFMGKCFQYKAVANFYEQIRRLRIFEYDYFEYTQNEALEHSYKAINFYSNSIEFDENEAKTNIMTVKTISLLTQVIYGIGQNMHSLLDNKRLISKFSIVELKKIIKSSRKSSIENEETGMYLIKYCDEIERQLKNYEKWSRINGTYLESSTKKIINNDKLEEITKNYIKNGNLKKALEYLMENSIQYDLTNDIVLLLSRYNTIRKKSINGIITNEEFRVSEAQIAKSTLELIEVNN